MSSVPLSLYIDLEKGQVADLEVIAKTALAWDALIKEIFYIVDPSLDVRVEIVSGTEGSLSLNALVKAIGKVAHGNPKTAGAIAGILAIFATEPVSHLSEHFWDQVYEAVGHIDGDENALTEERKHQIAEEAAKIVEDNIAIRQKKGLFEEVSRDPSIKGIGATTEKGERPQYLVPRSEFSERAGKEVVIQETVERQTLYKTKTVTLIRPVLKAEAAMWRFQDNDGHEFSARMKDPDYIEALKSKSTGAPLGIGIEMQIEFEIKQERSQGVWHDEEISVRRVLFPKAGITSQGKLF